MSLRRHHFSNAFSFFVPTVQLLQHTPQNEPKQTNAKRLEETDILEEDIPTEFIDHFLSYEIMDEPVLLDGMHIMDFLNLQKWWQKSGRNKVNPVTNSPYISLTPLPELKQKITDFVELKINIQKELIKLFEEKVKQAQQKAYQEKIEKEKLLEKYLKQRIELTKKIELSVGKIEESQLNALLVSVDRLDKKIHKLKLGNQYHTHPSHLKERIQHLIKKREHYGDTTIDEEKLKMLLNKLETLIERKPNFFSRYRGVQFQTDENHVGLLAISEGAVLPRLSRDHE